MSSALHESLHIKSHTDLLRMFKRACKIPYQFMTPTMQ